jgi:hypothetical protein
MLVSLLAYSEKCEPVHQRSLDSIEAANQRREEITKSKDQDSFGDVFKKEKEF